MTITHPVGIDITVEVQWTAGVWTDITADVRFLQIQTAQRSRLQNTFDPGRMVVSLANTNRKYDPMYTSGTYYGKLKPGKPVRVLFDSGTATPGKYALTATTEAFSIDYDRSNKDSLVQLTCIDALALASQLSILAGDTPSLSAGQDADDRIADLCAAAGAEVSTVAAGGVYASYYSAEFGTVWDNTTSHNLLDEIRKVSDLEQAPQFSSYVLNFSIETHTRHWFKQRPRSATSQVTIGTGGLPFHDIVVKFDADEIVTAVSMSDDSSNTVQVIDATAIVDYGFRAPFNTYDRLPARNSEALEGAANAVIALRATEEFRVDALVIKPGSDASYRKYVPELELLDRITVSWTPTGTGSALTGDYFIDGITHDVSPGDWTTTYSLMSAARFDAAIPDDLFIWGSSLVGGSDVIGL